MPVFLCAGEIHEAVKADDIAKVRALLLKDPSLVNSVTADGYTPLHWAVYKNSSELASLLIAKGAKLDLKTSDGYTALHLAISENAVDVLKVIVTETSAVYSDLFLEKHLAAGDKTFRGEELQDANRMLTKLVKMDPGNEKMNLAYGLSCYAMGDYPRAKMAFNRLLMSNENNARARLELARTYLAAGQKQLARVEFNNVLALNPPPKAEKNIRDILKKLDKGGAEKWTFHGRIDIGAFNDSNVNVGPETATISISPISYGSIIFDELVLSQESQPVEDNGVFLSVVGVETYDAGEPGKWLLGLNGAYYKNWLEDSAEYENGFYQLGVMAQRVGIKTMAFLPVRASRITSGDDDLVTIYGFSPRLICMSGKNRNMHWLTSGLLEARDYDDLDDRDGSYVSIGETVIQHFGINRSSVSLGVTAFHDYTDSAVYEHNGFSWTAAANFNILKNTSLYARLRHMSLNYDEREVLAPEDRKDTQDMFSVGLAQKISEHWVIDVNYRITDNDSTFSLYQYERDVVTLRTSLLF